MRPISTNRGSMEVGEYGLTRGTCFVASRLEVVEVAELLWVSWCVLGVVEFFVHCFFLSFLFSEPTRPAASIGTPCLVYLFTSNEEQNSERYVYAIPLPGRPWQVLFVFADGTEKGCDCFII